LNIQAARRSSHGLQKRHLCLLITEALLAATATMMPFIATIMAIASPVMLTPEPLSRIDGQEGYGPLAAHRA
jgi:hypothetical protein